MGYDKYRIGVTYINKEYPEYFNVEGAEVKENILECKMKDSVVLIPYPACKRISIYQL